MISCSLGIMAYNEEANIGRLIERLLLQKTHQAQIGEIVIIASGCTDKTEDIVREKSKKDPRIKLVVQKRRRGKASAVNLFIKKAKNPVFVMVSADVLPRTEAVERLVLPFRDKNVGMTAAHVIPTNKPKTFMGYYVVTFWKLHHEVAKRAFKAGEMVAWRNVIPGIDPQSSTDETNIAALILKKGLKTVYTPGAIVYNRGPENFNDYVRVRRRHIAAYYHLKEVVGLSYLPPTMDNSMVLKLYWQLARPKNPKEAVWFLGVMATETLGRMIAWYDWRIKGEHHPIWPIAESTKTLPNNI